MFSLVVWNIVFAFKYYGFKYMLFCPLILEHSLPCPKKKKTPYHFATRPVGSFDGKGKFQAQATEGRKGKNKIWDTLGPHCNWNETLGVKLIKVIHQGLKWYFG